jgi:hypothetical protein
MWELRCYSVPFVGYDARKVNELNNSGKVRARAESRGQSFADFVAAECARHVGPHENQTLHAVQSGQSGDAGRRHARRCAGVCRRGGPMLCAGLGAFVRNLFMCTHDVFV